MQEMVDGGAEKLSKCVSRGSAVGWTPGVTDWLTDKSRRVGATGN